MISRYYYCTDCAWIVVVLFLLALYYTDFVVQKPACKVFLRVLFSQLGMAAAWASMRCFAGEFNLPKDHFGSCSGGW